MASINAHGIAYLVGSPAIYGFCVIVYPFAIYKRSVNILIDWMHTRNMYIGAFVLFCI